MLRNHTKAQILVTQTIIGGHKVYADRYPFEKTTLSSYPWVQIRKIYSG